jgi:NAD(P)H-dependent FMN reductase
MNTAKILILPASLRRASLNRKLAELAASILTAQGHTVDLADMAEFDTPSYNGDVESADGIPAGAVELKKRMLENDAFIIVSPEYNGSIPGNLKNLIDWMSRFKPHPFGKLNMLLMSASPSMSGANMGLWHLRIPLEKLGARVYPAMFSLAVANKAFTDEGKIADEALAGRLEKMMEEFLELVKKV